MSAIARLPPHLAQFQGATSFQSEINNDRISRSMKASTFCFTTILVAASLFTSKAFAVTYSVRSDSGTQCYRLDAPAGYTPDLKHLYDPSGFPYDGPGNVPGEGLRIPISAGAAEVAAV